MAMVMNQNTAEVKLLAQTEQMRSVRLFSASARLNRTWESVCSWAKLWRKLNGERQFTYIWWVYRRRQLGIVIWQKLAYFWLAKLFRSIGIPALFVKRWWSDQFCRCSSTTQRYGSDRKHMFFRGWLVKADSHGFCSVMPACNAVSDASCGPLMYFLTKTNANWI